jgi:hypothetical protein
MWLFFQPADESARPWQNYVKVVDSLLFFQKPLIRRKPPKLALQILSESGLVE